MEVTSYPSAFFQVRMSCCLGQECKLKTLHSAQREVLEEKYTSQQSSKIKVSEIYEDRGILRQTSYSDRNLYHELIHSTAGYISTIANLYIPCYAHFLSVQKQHYEEFSLLPFGYFFSLSLEFGYHGFIQVLVRNAKQEVFQYFEIGKYENETVLKESFFFF